MSAIHLATEKNISSFAGIICKAKFKNIKDTYMKQHKKIPTSTGSAATSRQMSDSLSFILPHVGVQRG